MNQTDIIWTALMKVADNIERADEPVVSSYDVADVLRDVAEQIAVMTTYGREGRKAQRMIG